MDSQTQSNLSLFFNKRISTLLGFAIIMIAILICVGILSKQYLQMARAEIKMLEIKVSE
ncbi:hypothetical protein KAS79_01570 [Candidatus Parcubacteria bacterium]|nr:hypothetical protein [Candidatus Parcubacteria bacterium]